MNPSPIILTTGNLPLIAATLYDQSGNPVNLTGCTVAFAWQGATVNFVHPANVVTPLTGQVSYQFAGAETAVAGDYCAQWQVTDGGGAMTVYPVPGGTIPFQLVAPLPRVQPATVVQLRQMFEPVRATLGDLSARFRKYSDDAITSVLRTCLLIGRVPGQALGPDRLSITPGIVLPSDMALLMYHAAKMFIGPNVGEYSYKTRALQERFGRQDIFYFELEQAIYELENGAMFASFQTFYAWVNAQSGVDVWGIMTDMNTQAPVATVTIGRAGVTFSTT